MFRELMVKLVCRLGINSGQRGTFWADDPAYKAVLAALLGESEHKVAVVDVPFQGRRYLILGPIDPNQRVSYPLLVCTDFHQGADPHNRWGWASERVLSRLESLSWLGRERTLATVEVASWFIGRCVGLEDGCDNFPKTWAPAAVESHAKITIAGDLGKRVKTTRDTQLSSNTYKWFDLTKVPVGGSVYRISCTDTLWVFTRREDDRWEVTVAPDVSWATTSPTDGANDFGALLDGALEAYRLFAKETVV